MTATDVLQQAIRKVPSVKYALGVAGIAAAAALVVSLVGSTKSGLIIMSCTFVAMVLLYVFSILVASKGNASTIAGLVLMYAVILFFCSFMGFTISAFAGFGPKPWADFLGIKLTDTELDKPRQPPAKNKHVNVPGYGELTINDSDRIADKSVLEGYDRFTPAIYRLVTKADLSTSIRVGDGEGMLTAWLLPGDEVNCFNLMTLYTDANNTREFGSRDACRINDAWITRIPKVAKSTLHFDPGEDGRIRPFLLNSPRLQQQCLNDVVAQIENLTPEAVAAKCIVIGYTPEVDWLSTPANLKAADLDPFGDLDAFAYGWYSQRRYGQSLRLFETLGLFKDRCWNDQMVGTNQWMLNRLDEAIASFTRALDKCPDDIASRSNRADIYVRLGMFPEAQRDINLVVQADPQASTGPGKTVRALADQLKNSSPTLR
ncbi:MULTISPECIES: tetratricopeptide repeat protein [unclassified Mesorhizobium]|uniref:tetratricopeptide repeat protein n=1 Tax=unclassified Mesorhizobium TaxID=325217 RepID=UPI000F7513E0|nr:MULTISPECIES: tetratricopeptide repeat protein [unclassified Mesorhizobium]AZO05039.1 tetratricopeptide repeat protein [Mesorhizobium sp. M2A.F.Ca.ET.043.02.1.1]RWB42992.1 MAG: tetratricopeptide repeat protein [Mesorhizobium sp.]RWB55479.1 MAG: tetratricopeptide repeat protein [Mesorhizobium sp.]RWB88043.1 MAG: tetratricopeptide repeat protein [Mesorhizobium sp.]RWC12738.1 MAG: tetratricopeptide repeat protein [Mesorhizobium sp.]